LYIFIPFERNHAKKKNTATLTQEKRKNLEHITSKGKHSSQIYRNG
jgi:hypothetical protein